MSSTSDISTDGQSHCASSYKTEEKPESKEGPDGVEALVSLRQEDITASATCQEIGWFLS
jgi:hypothetical protein